VRGLLLFLADCLRQLFRLLCSVTARSQHQFLSPRSTSSVVFWGERWGISLSDSVSLRSSEAEGDACWVPKWC
jgi:hypothetical protein